MEQSRKASRRTMVDKSLALFQGVPSSIPGSPSLWDKTLSCGPAFWEVFRLRTTAGLAFGVKEP